MKSIARCLGRAVTGAVIGGVVGVELAICLVAYYLAVYNPWLLNPYLFADGTRIGAIIGAVAGGIGGLLWGKWARACLGLAVGLMAGGWLAVLLSLLWEPERVRDGTPRYVRIPEVLVICGALLGGVWGFFRCAQSDVAAMHRQQKSIAG